VTAVRPAGPDDLEAVAASEAENLGPDAWSAELVASGIAGQLPTVRYLVAERDGRVVGHAVASITGAPGDAAELQRVAVTPASRRTGVASALLDAVVSLAVAGRADRLLLEVREDNQAALAFYAARGFVEVDRRRRYYRDGATAVVLRLPLGGGCGSGGPGE
jgi:[ribosomal protein S18]-alanine N-acetyltransferase